MSGLGRTVFADRDSGTICYTRVVHGVIGWDLRGQRADTTSSGRKAYIEGVERGRIAREGS